jgi:hypothetical protein
MRIDPKHLMIIAEISDAGGFTEAASSLGTSQPPISRVVKMLGQRLGEPLTRDLRSFQALSTRRTRSGNWTNLNCTPPDTCRIWLLRASPSAGSG